MKKSDIAMIILIAGVSMGIAFAIASAIPALKVSDQKVKVDTIQEIKSDVTEPDTTVFNSNAVNPTVRTVIGRDAQQ